jgi:hypothetical protein
MGNEQIDTFSLTNIEQSKLLRALDRVKRAAVNTQKDQIVIIRFFPDENEFKAQFTESLQWVRIY